MAAGRTTAETLRAPDFKPVLRTDLKFFRGGAPSIVVVHDPRSGKRHQLCEIECMVAQEVDGTFDLDELTKRAQLYLQAVTRD